MDAVHVLFILSNTNTIVASHHLLLVPLVSQVPLYLYRRKVYSVFLLLYSCTLCTLVVVLITRSSAYVTKIYY